MKPVSVYSIAFVVLFSFLTNGAVIVNNSENLKDFVETQATGGSTAKPRTEEAEKPKKLTRREKCCNLGRDVAKIGETCRYTSNVDEISPNRHFHQMKTAVWKRTSHPINRRLLAKCKPHKVFYEKCCNYEYSQIEQDLIKERKMIHSFLRQLRKNTVEEDEGVTSDGASASHSVAVSQNGRHRFRL
ncbi:uncharacterized protein LOC111340393 [Stylophora pistillata]|uniref:Uncharacterized protein n=1 Tax=Stylophora pistillata TaxID=50429 RepID=A0A2B4RNC8_STYPI|nr:uncharacterized protein LOC111340393 [Stylophora pistillata]PFX17775.1 hypothetical protein AWC38_SpisGene17882 [Stylophora pistillata]